MTSAIFAIGGWLFICGLVVLAFWSGRDRESDLERMERVEGRAEPSPYARAISDATAWWAEDMRQADELEQLYRSPAYGEPKR